MSAVIKALAKYGSKAIAYAWAHKAEILKWLDRGMTIAYIVSQIKAALGL